MNTICGILKPFLNYLPRIYLRETNVLSNLYSGNISVKRRIRKSLNKIAYRNADGIICQSQFMANEVSSLLNVNNQNCYVINNPVIIPKIQQNVENYDLIALGNLNLIKGYDRLLEIMILLKSEKITLGIIGEGPERSNIEDFIQKNGLTNITLLGHISNPADYLANAKALLITSTFESFPNASLEAGILGIPTIAYDVPGGLKEIITNGLNGFLIENNDKMSFAKHVRYIIKNSINKKSIIKITKSRYSIDVILKKYDRLLKSVNS